MISELWDVAQSNPILVGGVGTVAFGSAMYFIKGIPIWINSSVRRLFTVELVITSEKTIYRELIRVLTKYRISALARNYSLQGYNVVAGYGHSYGFFRGRLISFSINIIEKNMKLDEKLTLTIFSRNKRLLDALIEEATPKSEDGCITVCKSGLGGELDMSTRCRRRGLDTVFTNHDIKDKILQKIKWFYENEDWYIRRGIPYKLTFLLHGEPGTGKTSLVYAITSEVGCTLATLSSVKRCDKFFHSIGTKKSIFVIEDIDMLSVSREDPTAQDPDNQKSIVDMFDSGKDALHSLINTMDGLGTPSGLILFITTNYRERLDSALIRPGRIDCDIEVGKLGRAETEQMYVAFFGESERRRIVEYISSPDFRPHTGADLQVLFMGETPEGAINGLFSGERKNNVIEMRARQ